jgi:hypothetical protein
MRLALKNLLARQYFNSLVCLIFILGICLCIFLSNYYTNKLHVLTAEKQWYISEKTFIDESNKLVTLMQKLDSVISTNADIDKAPELFNQYVNEIHHIFIQITQNNDKKNSLIIADSELKNKILTNESEY